MRSAVVGPVVGIGMALCLSRAAAAEPASPPGPLDWLVGSWSEARAGGAPPLSGRSFVEATFTPIGTGLHGLLREVGPSGHRTTLAAYTIAVTDGHVSLRVVERDVTYRLKGTASPQHVWTLRPSSKPGTIIVEFALLDGKLLVRHAYGPQHGATVEMTHTLAPVAPAAD